MTEGEGAPGSTRAPALERQHASALGGGRGGTTSGWIVKILLLGAADAIAIAGLAMAIDHEAWGYVAVLAVSLVAVNVDLPAAALRADEVPVPGPVLPRRVRHLPGAVHGLRLDDELWHGPRLQQDAGHRPDPEPIGAARGRSDALRPHADGRSRWSVRRLRPASTPRPSSSSSAPTTELTELDLADAQLTTLVTTGRTFVESVDDLTGVRAGDVRTLPGYPDPDTYQMPGETEDAAITISGGQAVESRSTRVYDADAGTITDTSTDPPVVYHEEEGFFVAEDGTQLSPGFTARVGFDNYEEVFTSSEFRGPFFRVLAWNLVFAFAIGRRHVRPRPAPRRGLQRPADERAQDLPLADHHPLRPARSS